ncbi:hypothetical protein ACFE04_020943 [Oxalis oulophora]
MDNNEEEMVKSAYTFCLRVYQLKLEELILKQIEQDYYFGCSGKGYDEIEGKMIPFLKTSGYNVKKENRKPLAALVKPYCGPYFFQVSMNAKSLRKHFVVVVVLSKCLLHCLTTFGEERYVNLMGVALAGVVHALVMLACFYKVKHFMGLVPNDAKGVVKLKDQIDDINLNVGTESELGESIIKDVKGIEELKASLSSKEYQIISECALSNISETPHIIPSLKKDTEAPSSDAIESVIPETSESFETETPSGEVWIAIKVSVVVNLIELCLCIGEGRDASLATVKH